RRLHERAGRAGLRPRRDGGHAADGSGDRSAVSDRTAALRAADRRACAPRRRHLWLGRYPGRMARMIAAVILAAGASTRFGSPKQRILLPPVLARVRAARSIGEIVIVLGAHEVD